MMATRHIHVKHCIVQLDVCQFMYYIVVDLYVAYSTGIGLAGHYWPNPLSVKKLYKNAGY